MALFALRGPSGRFSQIFTSREDVELFVHQAGIANADIGLVSFTPICSVKATIEIPWEEGFGSLESRLEQHGVRSEESEGGDSSLRSPSEPEARNTQTDRKPVKGRRRTSVSRNGKAGA